VLPLLLQELLLLVPELPRAVWQCLLTPIATEEEGPCVLLQLQLVVLLLLWLCLL
jgi:hypothetical protein